MASLGNLTKRIAMAPVNLATGTAKNIGSTIKSAVSANLGLASLRPSNIFRSTLEAAGLSGIVPATLDTRGGGGGPPAAFRGGIPSMPAPGAPAAGAGAVSGDMTPLLQTLNQLVQINTSMAASLSGILDAVKGSNVIQDKNSILLQSLSDLVKQQTLAQIEARREAAQRAVPAAPGAVQDPTKKGGGILGALGAVFGSVFGFFGKLVGILTGAGRLFTGILSAAGGLVGILGSVLGFFTSIGRYFVGLLKLLNIGRIVSLLAPIGSFLTGLGSFLLRFAGPIAAVAGILLSLEAKDWEAFFGKFTGAFKALLEGDFLTALVNVVTAIPELLIKGIGRLMANIIEFFGFKDAADAIRNFLDTFDLAKVVIDVFTYIKDMVVNAFTAVKDFFTEFFSGWNISEPIVNAFNWVYESIVGVFDGLRNRIAELLGFDLVGSIGNAVSSVVNAVWSFFSELPSKAADFIGSLLPDWVKGTWKKLFGSSTESGPAPAPSATPLPRTTPAPTATTTTTTTPLSPALTSQAPAPSPTATVPAAQPVTPVTPEQSLAEFGAVMARELTAPAGADLGSVMGAGMGVLSTSPMEFNQRSVNAAASREMGQSAPPVVINTTNNTSGGGQGGSPSQRSAGAAKTSVQQSHIDRALYGIAYGAGYA